MRSIAVVALLAVATTAVSEERESAPRRVRIVDPPPPPPPPPVERPPGYQRALTMKWVGLPMFMLGLAGVLAGAASIFESLFDRNVATSFHTTANGDSLAAGLALIGAGVVHIVVGGILATHATDQLAILQRLSIAPSIVAGSVGAALVFDY